jgi:protein ImuB
MGRTACVDLPELPLQLLLRRHEEWRALPVAVVDRDKPQGVILWVNERARTYRVLPGMRYAVALSLVGDLRAGVVSEGEIEREVDAIVQHLGSFTPDVEASRDRPGVFWLRARGIMRLFPSFEAWAARISWLLGQHGFASRVVVGFSRWGTYAAARSGNGIRVFSNAAEETQHVREVAIDRLGVDPNLRDALARLGIFTLGDFIELPANGILERFGAEAHALHRKLRGDLWSPVQGEALEEPLRRCLLLDYPETQVPRLLLVIERLLRPLLDTMNPVDAVLSGLHLRLRFEDRTHAEDTLRPADGTRDLAQILRLVQLRLESRRLESGVEEVEVEITPARAKHEQLTLFAERRRDLRAANRALARVRAELGDAAVMRAKRREGHLPEARFSWEPLPKLESAQPRAVIVPPLVRRIRPKPLELPGPRHEPDGWLIMGPGEGPVDEITGPHVVAGGWWMRALERAYYFVRTRSGRLLWIFDDRRRRRWFLHGEVE